MRLTACALNWRFVWLVDFWTTIGGLDSDPLIHNWRIAMSDIDPNGPCMGYSEKHPDGKVFDSEDEMLDAGYVDHPDKIGQKPAPKPKADAPKADKPAA